MSDHGHLAALRGLLRGDIDSLERTLTGQGERAADFARFTEIHRIAGYAYRRLEGFGLLSLLPEPELAMMKHFYLRQWSRNEELAAEMDRLAGRCEDAGLEVLFFKGPLLAHRYYDDLDRRAISDLDILVTGGGARERAQHVLEAAGYRRTSRTPFGGAVTARFVHHLEYWSDDGIPLELHWTLQRHPSIRVDPVRIRDDRRSVTFRGRAYPAISDEYELVAQALGLAVDLQVGKVNVKPLIDGYHILRSREASLDWEDFLARRRDEGIVTMTFAYLDLLVGMLACEREFSRLAAALDGLRPEGDRAVRLDPGLLLHPSRWSLAAKIAAMRLYDTPVALAWGWWALSLPFRLAAYREETKKLFRRSSA